MDMLRPVHETVTFLDGAPDLDCFQWLTRGRRKLSAIAALSASALLYLEV